MWAATTGLNLGPPSLGARITSALSLHTYFGSPFLPVFRKRVKGEESQLDGGAPQAGVRVPRAVATCRVGPPAPPSLHPAPPPPPPAPGLSSSAGLGPMAPPQALCPVSFLPLKSGAQVCAVCAEASGLPASAAGRAPLSAPTGWLPPSPRGGARAEQGRGHLGRGVPGLSSSRGERLNLRWGGRAGLAARGAARHPSPPPGSLSFFRASECYSHRISILLLLFLSLQQHSVERATRRENRRKDSTPTPCRAPACSSATDIPET